MDEHEDRRNDEGHAHLDRAERVLSCGGMAGSMG
jgi:hypothetical protein